MKVRNNCNNKRKNAIYLRFKNESDKNERMDYTLSLISHYLKDYSPNSLEYYIDICENGIDSNRKEYKRLIDDLKHDKINIIFTPSISTLSRNYLDISYINNLLLEKNSAIISKADKLPLEYLNKIQDLDL